MNIDVNKKYQTRNGLPVKDLVKDDGAGTNYVISGVIEGYKHGEYWTLQGQIYDNTFHDDFDLIEVTE